MPPPVIATVCGAALPFVPVLACGIVVPVLLAIPVAMVTQHGWSDAMLYVIWPVLGGGVGSLVPVAEGIREGLERLTTRTPFLEALDLAGRLRTLDADAPVGAIGAVVAARAARSETA